MERELPEPRPVTRRTLLRRGSGALAGMSTLAGCTEEIGEEFPAEREVPVAEFAPDPPIHEKTDVLAEGITMLADADVTDPDEFETTLIEHGIEIESVEREFEILTIEYRSAVQQGILDDIGLIAGAYAALVAAEYDTTALDITIFDADSSSFGIAEITTDIAEQYNADELSAKEYGELVAETIESDRRPPDIDAEPDE